MTDTASLNDRVARFERTQWLAPYRGGYPRVPTVTALPTAREEYRFRLLCVQAAAGAADTFSVCLKSAGDTYSWVTVATG